MGAKDFLTSEKYLAERLIETVLRDRGTDNVPSYGALCLLVVVLVFLQFCEHLFPGVVLRAGLVLGTGCVYNCLEKAGKVAV